MGNSTSAEEDAPAPDNDIVPGSHTHHQYFTEYDDDEDALDPFDGIDTLGYRVLGVQPDSPAAAAGLVSFLDFLVGAEQKMLLGSGEDLEPGEEYDDVDLPALLEEKKGQPIEFLVWNIKSQAARLVNITPSDTWGGAGLLGVTIRLDNYAGAEDRLVRVLTVDNPKSPAAEAGLIPEKDFLLGTTHQTLDSVDQLAAVLREYEDQVVELYVYNTDTDMVRVVSLHPTASWEGSNGGVLGAEVGTGYLHRLPYTSRTTSGSSVERKVRYVISEQDKQNSTQQQPHQKGSSDSKPENNNDQNHSPAKKGSRQLLELEPQLEMEPSEDEDHGGRRQHMSPSSVGKPEPTKQAPPSQPQNKQAQTTAYFQAPPPQQHQQYDPNQMFGSQPAATQQQGHMQPSPTNSSHSQQQQHYQPSPPQHYQPSSLQEQHPTSHLQSSPPQQQQLPPQQQQQPSPFQQQQSPPQQQQNHTPINAYGAPVQIFTPPNKSTGPPSGDGLPLKFPPSQRQSQRVPQAPRSGSFKYPPSADVPTHQQHPDLPAPPSGDMTYSQLANVATNPEQTPPRPPPQAPYRTNSTSSAGPKYPVASRYPQPANYAASPNADASRAFSHPPSSPAAYNSPGMQQPPSYAGARTPPIAGYGAPPPYNSQPPTYGSTPPYGYSPPPQQQQQQQQQSSPSYSMPPAPPQGNNYYAQEHVNRGRSV